MSVPPKTDQDVPDPHRRTLPHFPVNEQGMRELEIWIKERLGSISGFIRYVFKNRGKWLYVETTSSQTRYATVNFPSIGQLFNDSNYGGGGIIFAETGAGVGHNPEIGLYNGQWIGYMDGGQEIVYGQGGDFIRITGGGNITFIGFEPAFNDGNSGNFTLDLTGIDGGSAGTITVNSSNQNFYLVNEGDTVVWYDHLGNPLVTYTG